MIKTQFNRKFDVTSDSSCPGMLHFAVLLYCTVTSCGGNAVLQYILRKLCFIRKPQHADDDDDDDEAA